MKNKILILIIFTSLLTSQMHSNIYEIDATPGILIQSSVKKCRGRWYGKHKKHWHRARKSKRNNKWYAKSQSLGSKKPRVCR